MLLDNIVLYEKHHLTEINSPEDAFYYFFDYDERSYTINMEFPHFHQFYEFCIFLDETANHLIEGDIYDLQFLDIVAIKPSVLHKTQYPHGGPKKRLIINFMFPMDTEGIRDDLKTLFTIFDKPVPIYRFVGSYRDQIFGILNDIFRLTNSDHGINTLLIHNKFIEFLTKIYLFQNMNTYVVHSSENNLTSKVYSITSYIHEHYKENLSLEHIAKQFYISSYYLSHQFKKITGFTLNNYIQMTRIRNAQQLLLTSDMKVTHIAEACGFLSFSQFNRTFNKHCGTSPTKYRSSKGLKTLSSIQRSE
jgi:AraC-like DNA-binding protein